MLCGLQATPSHITEAISNVYICIYVQIALMNAAEQ
jgi:hypothetical protein